MQQPLQRACTRNTAPLSLSATLLTVNRSGTAESGAKVAQRWQLAKSSWAEMDYSCLSCAACQHMLPGIEGCTITQQVEYQLAERAATASMIQAAASAPNLRRHELQTCCHLLVLRGSDWPEAESGVLNLGDSARKGVNLTLTSSAKVGSISC